MLRLNRPEDAPQWDWIVLTLAIAALAVAVLAVPLRAEQGAPSPAATIPAPQAVAQV